MPATADDVAPNEWECKVFIAVADHGSYLAAAEHLSRQIGRSYTRRAVNQVIKKIEAWLKTPPFEGTHSQKKLTPAARSSARPR
ncbi:helix-turn-helix domain-containing protein [Dactylosporangium darangshiense]|uniref:helix-turn-helix domain-containing protein n=1 Tax=Dactylosporangium darangshiense TaxID=579108 RepID=UPI0036428C3E